MKYKITKRRKEPCDCSNQYCDKEITTDEWAYTSSPKPLCGSCGRLENQYDNDLMKRPAV